MMIDGVMYEVLKTLSTVRLQAQIATGYIWNFTNGSAVPLADLPGAFAPPPAVSVCKRKMKEKACWCTHVSTGNVVVLRSLTSCLHLHCTGILPCVTGLCYVAAEITNISINGTPRCSSWFQTCSSRRRYMPWRRIIVAASCNLYHYATFCIPNSAITKFNLKHLVVMTRVKSSWWAKRAIVKNQKQQWEDEANVSSAPEDALGSCVKLGERTILKP